MFGKFVKPISIDPNITWPPPPPPQPITQRHKQNIHRADDEYFYILRVWICVRYVYNGSRYWCDSWNSSFLTPTHDGTMYNKMHTCRRSIVIWCYGIRRMVWPTDWFKVMYLTKLFCYVVSQYRFDYNQYNEQGKRTHRISKDAFRFKTIE